MNARCADECRQRAAGVLPTLRDALSGKPDWRGEKPRRLFNLMFLYGYTTEPAKDFAVEAACECIGCVSPMPTYVVTIWSGS